MNDVLNEALIEELRLIMEDEFPSLLETFLEESARQFSSAKQAWSCQDLDLLRRCVHSLKGSCANVGAELLQSTCAELEDSAKNAQSAEIPRLLSAAETQLAEVCSAVRIL